MRDNISAPWKLMCLVGMHCGLYAIVNIFVNKSILLPFGAKVLGTTLIMTVANGVTDVVNQAYGLKAARRTVLAAFCAAIVVWSVISIILLLPTARMTPGFDNIMHVGLVAAIGGLCSHLISQWYLDTRVFHVIRTHTPHWGFAARYNISNVCSVFTSTLIIVTAKYIGERLAGIHAVWEWQAVLSAIPVKFMLGAALTPLFALGAYWAKLPEGQNV